MSYLSTDIDIQIFSKMIFESLTLARGNGAMTQVKTKCLYKYIQTLSFVCYGHTCTNTYKM